MTAPCAVETMLATIQMQQIETSGLAQIEILTDDQVRAGCDLVRVEAVKFASSVAHRVGIR